MLEYGAFFNVKLMLTWRVFMRALLLFIWLPAALSAQVNHWETVVYEDDSWRYIVPVSAVDPLWNTVSFNDALWLVGQGGFGYGDGDDNTNLAAGTISCYQRITFNIVDITKIDQAIFNYDYDDDFVAYLNGTEIARGAISGSPPAYNQTSGGLHEAQMYSGGYPEQIIIDNVTVQALLTNGNNVLCIQTHNESGTSSDMSSRAWLQLGINDASTDYGAVPSWFNPPFAFTDSDLPIVILNTFGVSIPDEPKIHATMGIINNGPGMRNYITDPQNEYNGNIGIEQRGSSSSMFPKKQYGIETRKPDSTRLDVSLFDWPAENDYVLYAPYSDKTLMRNVLTYKLGFDLGHWAPRTQFCEVVLNGEYMGVYVFMEKIKQSNARVNVDKLWPGDTVFNELTGGYIIKIDKLTAGGVVSWSSPIPPYTGAWQDVDFQNHDPDLIELQPVQQQYIENYVTDFENALDGPNFTDPVLGYAPYIDIQSFYDYWIINELSHNVDGFRLSTFLHKHRNSEGGKLVAGPLWDFNLAWANANYCNGSNTTGWEMDFFTVCSGDGFQNPFWWWRLLQDPNYANGLNCRWQELRANQLHIDTLLNWIDSTVVLLNESQQRNFSKWPIHGVYVWPNNFVGNTYLEDVDYMKQWITNRIAWMDANMFGTCTVGVDEIPETSVSVYPNPTNGVVTFQFSEVEKAAEIIIITIIGEVIARHQVSGVNSAEIDLSEYTTGLYLYQFITENKVIASGKLIIE